MGIEGAFAQLSQRITQLRDGLQQDCTVFDDCPHSHSLVDKLCNAAQDILGWVEEARVAVAKGHKALEVNNDLDTARRRLQVCQRLIDQISRHAGSVLFANETCSELKQLSRLKSKFGDWHGYATAASETITQLKSHLELVQAAAAECWQEIASRVGVNNINIQNSNIGQQNGNPVF
jgi:hypothetical protein